MNEGAPYQSFEIAVGAVSVAQLAKLCPGVDGAPTFLGSTGTVWLFQSTLPAGLVVSADGSSGAIACSPGGFWVNTGVGPTGGGLTAQAQLRFVSTGGVDGATANGSFQKPFRTVQFAISSITDAASTKPYAVIAGPGTSFGSFTCSPWIFVYGAGPQLTFLDPVAAQCLGAGFAGAAATISGIANATVNTAIKADFAAIGSTGAGFLELWNLELLDAVTCVGATVNNQFLMNGCYWFQAFGKNLTLTNIGSAEINNVTGGFGNVVVSSTGTFASFVDLNSCNSFFQLSETWTGANQAIRVSVTITEGWPFSGDIATVTGIGAELIGQKTQKLIVVSATPAEIQFQAGFPGAAGSLIGCGGENQIISNLGLDSAVTLHKPPSGTRINFKNQSAFIITLTFADAAGVSGDPSYIGPFDTLAGFFTSGTWCLEPCLQSGTIVLAGGVSAAIPADISAKSVAVATLRTYAGVFGTPKCTDFVNGSRATTGSFKVHSIDATGADVPTDNGTYNWFVWPGRA